MAASVYLAVALTALAVAVVTIVKLGAAGINGWLVGSAGICHPLYDQVSMHGRSVPVWLHVVYRRIQRALASRRGAISRRVDAGSSRAQCYVTPCMASLDGKTRPRNHAAPWLVGRRRVGNPSDFDYPSTVSRRAVS